MNTHSDLRIQFSALIPMTGSVLENGDLVIRDGFIHAIETRKAHPKESTVIDLSDHLLLPGFINAHCHLSLSCLKDKVPKTERFTDWVRALLKISADIPFLEKLASIRAGAEEMLSSGVTTLADYISQPELFPEYAELPLRKILFLEALGFNSNRVQHVCKEIETIFNSHDSHRNAFFQFGLAPHAPYSVSPHLFKALKSLAQQRKLPFSCHVAEFPEEIRFLREGGGEMEAFLIDRGVFDENWKPPKTGTLQYLDSLDVLQGMVAVHLNHIESSDLELMRQRHTGAVFCPGSTQWFGRKKILPLRKMLDIGITAGLGTDSLASTESLNFLGELRIAEMLIPEITRMEWLEMATRGGAEVLGSTAGIIRPGAPADLIGFRLSSKPTRFEDIPFDKSRQQVDFSMIAGQQI
jgi:aminodeoxyfutalosine deaminase